MSAQLIATPVEPDHADDSRWERIDRQWMERPVPTPVHSILQKRLVRLLDQAIAGVESFYAEAFPEISVDQPGGAPITDPNYMTADVLVNLLPMPEPLNEHQKQPGFLAVEIISPNQKGMFRKAERWGAWGTPHVWIIDPDTRECFEYHGGNTFILERENLQAGLITISLVDLFAGIK